jgi:transposase
MALDLLALAADAAAAPPPPRPFHTRLTEEQRWTIVALHKENYTQERIARRVLCGERSVRRVLKRYKLSGKVGSGGRSGRPRSTDEAMDTAIAGYSHCEPFATPKRVRRKLNLSDISPRTIDRRLQEAGLFGRVARKKRHYSGAEVAARLRFAEGYKSWTAEQWEQVLFSDEKCFYGYGFCGNIYVRRPKGEEFNAKYCAHKQAHPVKVNVWACFAAAGPGFSHIFSGAMDGDVCASILKENLAPSAALVLPAGKQQYLLLDNASTHRAEKVKSQIFDAGIIALDFPPYSPDLNPIENLWAAVAREVEVKEADTIEALQDVVAAEWQAVTPEYCKKLAHSMPRRCKAVIDAKGWHTKY